VVLGALELNIYIYTADGCFNCFTKKYLLLYCFYNVYGKQMYYNFLQHIHID